MYLTSMWVSMALGDGGARNNLASFLVGDPEIHTVYCTSSIAGRILTLSISALRSVKTHQRGGEPGRAVKKAAGLVGEFQAGTTQSQLNAG